jgi:hypothetical protein
MTIFAFPKHLLIVPRLMSMRQALRLTGQAAGLGLVLPLRIEQASPPREGSKSRTAAWQKELPASVLRLAGSNARARRGALHGCSLTVAATHRLSNDP